MPPRSSSRAVLLALGALTGFAFYRRRSARRLERVELYAEDGSMASTSDGSADGVRLLTLARDLIALAG